MLAPSFSWLPPPREYHCREPLGSRGTTPWRVSWKSEMISQETKARGGSAPKEEKCWKVLSDRWVKGFWPARWHGKYGIKINICRDSLSLTGSRYFSLEMENPNTRIHHQTWPNASALTWLYASCRHCTLLLPKLKKELEWRRQENVEVKRDLFLDAGSGNEGTGCPTAQHLECLWAIQPCPPCHLLQSNKAIAALFSSSPAGTSTTVSPFLNPSFTGLREDFLWTELQSPWKHYFKKVM